jgi:hypothetical protein
MSLWKRVTIKPILNNRTIQMSYSKIIQSKSLYRVSMKIIIKNSNKALKNCKIKSKIFKI